MNMLTRPANPGLHHALTQKSLLQKTIKLIYQKPL